MILVMTNEEMTAKAEASHADWWSRADALGVIPTGDSWAALNPGAGWAGNEDRAAADIAAGPDYMGLRSDHTADHYTERALDEQRWGDMTPAADETSGEADVA